MGELDTQDFALHIDLADSLVYVADRDAGLRVIDVSDLARPAEIGALDVSGNAVDIEVVDGTAYVADVTQSGILIHHICDSATLAMSFICA